jgi:hypothetical protein
MGEYVIRVSRRVPGLDAEHAEDLLDGTWVQDPASGDPYTLPESFVLTFKSADAATGKRTYHVSFTFRKPSVHAGVRELQTFAEDAVATRDYYLTIRRELPEWALPGFAEIPVLFGYFRPSGNPDRPGQLEVGLSLAAFDATWAAEPGGRYYVRKPPASRSLRLPAKLPGT